MTIAVAYVASANRSGSTLLAEILGSLPGVVAIGELSIAWHALAADDPCSCGRSLQRCPVWSSVLSALSHQHGIDARGCAQIYDLVCRSLRVRGTRALARLQSRPRSCWPADVRNYTDVLGTTVTALAAASRASVLVDTSKTPPGFLSLMLVPSVDVRVIHLVRDARAVANSELKAGDTFDVEARLAPPTRRSLRSASLWSALNLLIYHYGRSSPGYRYLRYEDLVRDPQATVTDVATSLGLSSGQLLMSGDRLTLAESHVAAGNPSRLAGRERMIREDLAWQTQLGRRDRALVRTLTVPAQLMLPARHGRPPMPADD